HFGDADGDRGEDDQRHDRADEHDEAVADRLHFDAEARIEGAEQDTDGYGDQHLHVKLAQRRPAGWPRRGAGHEIGDLRTAHEPHSSAWSPRQKAARNIPVTPAKGGPESAPGLNRGSRRGPEALDSRLRAGLSGENLAAG